MLVYSDRPKLSYRHVAGHPQSVALSAAQPLCFAIEECDEVELTRALLGGRKKLKNAMPRASTSKMPLASHVKPLFGPIGAAGTSHLLSGQ
jgi:hypothetical protein